MSATLREELALLPGPRGADGAPSWTLHDPVRNQFFRIDWPTFEILSRWSLGSAQAIAESVSIATPLQLEPDDVEAVAKFLEDNQLIAHTAPAAAREMAARAQRSRTGVLAWLVHHYLFFRVPLVRPDAWLAKLLPAVQVFYTRGFALATAIACAIGLFAVARQWDTFRAALTDTFNLAGLVSFALAIVCVKVLHELGHAFTAKRLGCRVPTMGVAFLVMWPVAYTDTNDAWRLTDRRARLAIALAGVATELIVAIWATVVWAFAPAGALRDGAFFLATTSWVTTLAINASPFMRFDGYFVLSDWLDLPNLHARSFALARHAMRERLFALGESAPEPFAPRLRAALIGFAWATWIYRLVLFLGIAVLVYEYFFKALGVVLFAIEIGWFILAPLKNELAEWWKRRAAIRASLAARRSGWVLVAIVVLIALPWPSRIATSGVLRAAESVPVFAPQGARIVAAPFREGDVVRAGQAIITLEAPDLSRTRASLEARIERARHALATAALEESSRARLRIAEEDLASARAELASLDEEQHQYTPRAPFDGVLRDVDPDVASGQWVARREKLGVLIRGDARLVETYLDEDAVKSIKLGDRAHFSPDSGALAPIALTVTHIDHDATRALPSGLFAAQQGGDVLVREKNHELVPERSAYRVMLRVDEHPAALAQHAWRGKVVIAGEWHSPAASALRHAAAILSRELGM